jgi:hypothetical protein
MIKTPFFSCGKRWPGVLLGTLLKALKVVSRGLNP